MTYIVFCILGMFVALLVILNLREKKRTEEMKKIARDMNFSFSDKYIGGDDALLTSLNQLAIFSQGVKQNGAWKLLNFSVHDKKIRTR